MTSTPDINQSAAAANDPTKDTNVGVPGDGADYAMWSQAGNVAVHELIEVAVNRAAELARDGLAGRELDAAIDELLDAGMDEIQDAHPEVNDTVVRENIYQFVRDDAERLHGLDVQVDAHGFDRRTIFAKPNLSDASALGAPGQTQPDDNNDLTR